MRPPPSKTNHPLNLQVQLVPPNSKERPSSRQSTDSSAEIDAQSLSRTPSNRSDASLYSSYSSAGSISTVGSSSTTSSGRRMIIPLYNLQAHNVMQNVIVDAGTDAKVAKFLKRGLEVIGLAVLEPVEVWGSGAVGVDETGRRVSIDYGRGEPAHTPTSSAVSLNTSEFAHEPSSTPLAHVVSPPATPTTSSARSGSRKIFGKLFKRKEGDVGTPPPSPLPLNQSVMPSMPSMESTRSKRTSLLSAHGHVLSASVSEPPLQPPVLGIQPSLRSPTVPPKGRPTKYVWIVRKWLKGEPESMFRDVKDRLQEARNGNAAAGLEGIVEVRFEWSRGRSTQKRGRDGEHVRRESTRRRNRASLVGSSATPSTASLHHPSTQSPVRQPQSQSQRTLSPGNAPRRSVDSARSISPGPASIVTGESTDESGRAARREREEDDGDESDPEDSETPWTCTLVVRRLHAPPPARSPQHLGAGASPQPQPPQSIRVKVAAVVPTPHHPKVVALLKVSFPLPDVEIERVAVHRRVVTPQGIARPAVSPLPPAAPSGGSGKSSKFWGGGGGGKESGRVEAGRPASVMLTAEEIKDVVSCTALWLVVREGFGGVGRERRKGDRWMLRG